ncbi:hypothetical protein FA95DRAFT_560568 [Auriscalpium vulgare]|uniref:Uncharacterized protein n=1 Tax=Auriscalpium vulgare TaxID=40419 RepID=A0ACB8RES6_9AGAM|nr:hypothetical protein FA95DRAFT_560568 [Auriscalpium vulgare]
MLESEASRSRAPCANVCTATTALYLAQRQLVSGLCQEDIVQASFSRCLCLYARRKLPPPCRRCLPRWSNVWAPDARLQPRYFARDVRIPHPHPPRRPRAAGSAPRNPRLCLSSRGHLESVDVSRPRGAPLIETPSTASCDEPRNPSAFSTQPSPPQTATSNSSPCALDARCASGFGTTRFYPNINLLQALCTPVASSPSATDFGDRRCQRRRAHLAALIASPDSQGHSNTLIRP